MTDQLDHAVERLVKASRADGALVWSHSGPTSEAIVLGSYPTAVGPGPLTCNVPAGTTGATEPGSAALPALLPELPAATGAERSLSLGDDLFLTVAWSDPATPPDLTGEQHRQALDEVGALAQLARHIHVAESDVERLRAVINGLHDGVVTLNPRLAQAAVNRAAAAVLNMAPGRHPESDFTAALTALARRSLNCDEIDSCISLLDSDPTATIECMWRFTGEPSHLFVVSRPVQYQGFHGRSWIFYNESQSAEALESLERAHSLLRASADGMLDPQALLEAVRDSSGRIVDFVYRDVNRATWQYLETTRDGLIGRTLLETMPNLEPSGLLARYAECANTHEPMILDEVSYDNEMLSGSRSYDIRGTYVAGDFITLTWRDVTERVETFHRLAESEERFRLLAENASDVVAYLREGVIEWVSPSVEGVLGAPPEHWIGRHMTETVPADELPNQAVVIGRIEAGEVVIARSRVVAMDGTTHWIHLHGRRFYDSSGEPDGLTIAFRVIDDEVRLQEDADEARHSRAEADERYRRLMDNSAVGMSIVTPDGRYEAINQALCDFFGYDAETLKTKTWQELTSGETLERDFRKADEVLAGLIDHYRVKTQYIHADGHPIWADLSVSCLRDSHGEVEYFIGAGHGHHRRSREPPAGRGTGPAESRTDPTTSGPDGSLALRTQSRGVVCHLAASRRSRRPGAGVPPLPPVARTRRRLFRLPLARRRSSADLPDRRLRARHCARPGIDFGPQSAEVWSAAHPDTAETRPRPDRTQQQIPDGRARRKLLHHVVRRLPGLRSHAAVRECRTPAGACVRRPRRRSAPAVERGISDRNVRRQ
jgi:PAS domain S-box-containing protein